MYLIQYYVIKFVSDLPHDRVDLPHDRVYLIQHYVIKFVSDLPHDGVCLIQHYVA